MNANMGPESSERVAPEDLVHVLNAYIYYADYLTRQQLEAVHTFYSFLSEETVSDTVDAINEVAMSHLKGIANLVGDLASYGYGVVVQDSHDNLLSVEGLGFDDDACIYFARCHWNDEIHTVPFDGENTFQIIHRAPVQAALPQQRGSTENMISSGAYL